MTRPPHRLLAAAAAATLALTACGGGDDSASGGGEESPLEGQSITVGSKDFDEQLLLGQMLIQVLEDAGADVTDSTALAGTVATREALVSGQIDVYMEYTGTGWITHLGNADPIPEPQEQWQAVKDADLEENGIAWLDYAPMNNTYSLAVNSENAGQFETLSDWADFTRENPAEATLCVESEFNNRDDGLPGLTEAYDVQVDPANVQLVDTGVVYDQTASGACMFGEIFTTDGRVAALDLKVLEDDQSFFPLYNPAPTFQQSRLEELSGVQEVLQPLTDALTNEEITPLNARISSEGELPEAVAEDWLTSNGIIGG